MPVQPNADQPPAVSPGRIETIDVARGVALVAMAVYHLAWDLEFFGYAEAGMTAAGGWKLFARAIASSFLALAGVSLFLGHGAAIRWRPFWRRFAMVAGAAAAITLATWFAMPQAFIFFGILHQIAFASLIGLLFLRFHWSVVAVVAAAVIAAPHFLRSPLFDAPVWWWSGLSADLPRSNDYVPVFPWLGAGLAGIAAAKLAAQAGLFRRLAQVRLPGWSSPLAFAGRHSLAVYLIHQPVLIACVYLFSLGWPAAVETPQVAFRQACERTCGETRNEEFCAYYCVCVLDRIEGENILDDVLSGGQNEAVERRLAEFAALCTAETDARLPPGGDQ